LQVRQEKLGERCKLSQEVSLIEDELVEPVTAPDEPAAGGSPGREGSSQAVRLVWSRAPARVDPVLQQRARAARWAPTPPCARPRNDACRRKPVTSKYLGWSDAALRTTPGHRISRSVPSRRADLNGHFLPLVALPLQSRAVYSYRSQRRPAPQAEGCVAASFTAAARRRPAAVCLAGTPRSGPEPP
jgi:hypothetical protein